MAIDPFNFWLSANDGGTPGTAGSGTKGPVRFWNLMRAIQEGSVLNDVTLNAPPAGPQSGDAYFTGTPASGAWAAQDNKIAVWDGAAWQFFDPIVGYPVGDMSTGDGYIWDGTTLNPIGGGGATSTDVVLTTAAAGTAIPTNGLIESTDGDVFYAGAGGYTPTTAADATTAGLLAAGLTQLSGAAAGTDTAAVMAAATVAGTDSAGQDYAIGDQVVTYPNGSTQAVDDETDLAQATVAGTDSNGVAVAIGDWILTDKDGDTKNLSSGGSASGTFSADALWNWNSRITLAHGSPTPPKGVDAYYVVKVAFGGYAVGDVLATSLQTNRTSAWVDATNVSFISNVGTQVILTEDKNGSSNGAQITPANTNIRLEAVL